MTTVSQAPGTRRRGRRWLTHLALIAGTLVMVYPLLWMVGGSFKDEKDIFSQLNPFPSSLDPRNYIAGWTATDPTFTRFYFNSLLIAVLAVAGNVIACTLTAYAFARLEFRGKKVFFGIMLGSIMLPAHALLIPQYVLFFNLGWVNTYLPLVVPKFLATDAFFIFLMVQFIRGIPRELDEAARIDGCGHFRIFFRVLIPLMGPALATCAIFTFIWTWSDFFTPLIYLTDPNSYTVSVALKGFLDATSGSNWGAMFAMSVVTLIPLFLVFVFGQKFLVKGIATTGGK
jgi:multiple sugar transport system permease protein